MKDLQSRLATTLRIVRAASGMSQLDVASAFHRDQVFASRLESAKTVITPDILAQWVGICGGRRLIDNVIRQLQAAKRLLEYLDVPLMQA